MAKPVSKTNLPTLRYHLWASLKILCQNWRLFLPFLILALLMNAFWATLTGETVFTTEELSGVSIVTITGEPVAFGLLSFLIIWLVTIFILRLRLARQDIKLRDALYNALSPLISTFLLLLLAILQCFPIFILTIAFSAAVQTELFATAFYGSLFVIFAVLMIIFSSYLLSSTVIAMLAATAPGLYPMTAFHTASNLMEGKRTNFVLHLLALAAVLGLFWAIILVPAILLSGFIQQFEWGENFTLVPFSINLLASVSIIYAASYLYLYYRWLIDFADTDQKPTLEALTKLSSHAKRKDKPHDQK